MPRKWGQHFLRHKDLSEKIVSFADIRDTDTVLEIGPGKGILTEAIYKKTKKIFAIEVDKELSLYIKNKFPDINVINADVLKIELLSYINDDFKIISNLPYKISSPFILNLIEKWRKKVEIAVVLLQKELAERLIAKEGSKKYSPIGIYLRVYFEPEIKFHLSPGNFIPPPKVNSSLLVIKRRKEPFYSVKNPEEYKKFLSKLFSQRRKLIKNNLLKEECEIIKKSSLKELLSKRAEQVEEKLLFELYRVVKNGAG